MGSYKFSATTTGFYPVSLLDSYEQAGTLPADLVDVTDKDYTTYTGQAPDGKTRGSNKKGQPAWVDIPPPTPEQQRSQAVYRKRNGMAEASAVITPLQDALDTGIATGEETRQLTAWKTYRALLSRINPEDAPEIKWPDKPE
ncbi:tail fiber assembly protein [Serratia quinivorans]|uniref:tail fiber assembly protein n=1 Tax=Serratia quinivorans TaxID=137545 RepID=UPI002E77F7A6|nr:tail fiber assembly protein [Serratia quinivorans]